MRELLSETEYVCSFGYAVVPDDRNLEDTVKLSDEKMYMDKAAYKKKVAESGGKRKLRERSGKIF